MKTDKITHTEGKWDYDIFNVTKGSPKDGMYCGIFARGIKIAKTEMIREIPISKIELANAKLISAAPDLLKVCTDLISAFIHKENDKKGNQTRTDIFKYCPEFREIATAANNAVNKATE